jgi:GT2 family glycosyltransferase
MDSDAQNKIEIKAPHVYAVVLNWNGGPINLTCLKALLRCSYPRLDVVFVDNGSTDGSPEEVKKNYPQIDHIFIGENLGFTGGNNRGIRHALDRGADMVLILNNDVEVPTDFLQPMVDLLLQRPGIVGPKIVDEGNKLWCAGGLVAFHQNLTRLRGFGEMDNSAYGRTETVDYMPACCMLISREVFDGIGLLNEDYFCYLEDVEFCLRAHKAGFPVLYCPDSRVVHRFSHSTGGGYSAARKYMNALNSVRFLKTHGTLKSWLAFFLLDALALPLVLLAALPQGRTKGVLAKGKGILHGMAGRKVTRHCLERFYPSEEAER